MNKTRYIIAFAAAALMLSGCDRENLTSSEGLEDGLLNFRLSGLQLTKGELINSEDDMLAGVGTFTAAAWNGDYSVFVPEQTVTYKGSEWQTAAPIAWAGSDNKTFFAYANLPASGTVTNTCTSTEQKQTLTYTLPLDARAQNDIMLGWYKGNGGGTRTADITLVHPLTSLILKKGDMEIDGVKSITVSGLYASGTADVTYAVVDNKVVPTCNWGDTRTGSVTSTLEPTGSAEYISVAADSTIGTPFIVIPQTVAANQVKITVKAKVSGADKTLVVNVPAGNFAAGETNVFTLGGYNPYTYTFTLSDGTVSGAKSFNNTTVESTQTVTIASKKEYGGAESAAEWLIKSVQVGSADPTPVGDTLFSNIGGLSASQTDGGTKLSITAAARTSVNFGSHEYWVNKDGISGDTDGTGRSPLDWSGTIATSSSPLDLSKFNFQNETTNNPMTTANCYIIRHAGTYRIPLVYGNGVVDGCENPDSYAPTMAAGGDADLFLSPFQNHLGNGITSAFIENNDGCTASDAAIVWQDMAEVITNVQIVSGASVGTAGSYTASNVRYLQFTVDKSTVCQNNAIVAVKDGSGFIMWSWHIWTTNDPALLSSPISVWNNSTPSMEYKFFPLYNLGWIDPAIYPSRSDVKIVLQQKKSGNEIEIAVTQPSVANDGNGCYYQFGRKDPMPTDDVTGFTPDVSGGSTLSNAICNPGKFYNAASCNWCSTTYYNLWTGKKSNKSGKIDQDDDMIKTIYDPSPVGYKMPASNAFTGFTTTGENVTSGAPTNCNVSGSFDKGWYFYTVNPGTESTPTVFFPAAGSRDYDGGSVDNVGSNGYYWSAVSYFADYGYDLRFSSREVRPVYNFNYRANGFSVRPVLEPAAIRSALSPYTGKNL